MNPGKPLPHDAAPLHVTGQARYVDDIPLPGKALHLAFGLSAIAYGQVTALDLSAVRAAPGVVAVYGPEDFDAVPDCSPSAHDEPLISTGAVFYLGMPLFLVAADSHLAARKAARLAKVSYAEKPALLTVDHALAANSRFEDGPVIWVKGDAARGIDTAPPVVEGPF
ncbi:MAG: xanthine dehydrogenase molybdopterin binding subunit, partial [Paracoccaceae bacterium]